jgi:phosphate acyltransferase
VIVNKQEVRIALDAMGGDDAPGSVIEGAALAIEKHPDIKFLVYGDKTVLDPMLIELPKLLEKMEIIHTSEKVSADDKPSYALRNGKNSSMRLAVDSIKSGAASAMVSAGNTGALMAIAKIVLRTLPGISRPGIVTLLPAIDKRIVMLDLGANVDCNSDHLFEFAVMGDAFAKVILGLERPSIGLLNIGTEDVKGNEIIKAAWTRLKDQGDNLNFYGYVEGSDITTGAVDVVVADGFTGNVALKTAEGTAKLCLHLIKKAFGSSIFAKIGYMFVKPALKRTLIEIDERTHNGAMLVGLNGVVVKSHGSADKVAFANAISVAYELAKHKINDRIIEEINSFQEQ